MVKRPSGQSDTTRPVVSLLELPAEVWTTWLVPFLRTSKDLCRLSFTCTEFRKMLQDPSIWAELSELLDLRPEVLENTVTSTFGRRSKARNFDVVQAVTKVLAQHRLSGVRGLDLRGVSLGARGPSQKAPPLLQELTSRRQPITRLLLQGPGDRFYQWAGGHIEQHLRTHLAPHLVELGIEMVNPLALQKLLRKCENLRTLHLGGLWSVQFSDGQMTTAFKKGVCPALQVLVITDQRLLTGKTLTHLRAVLPGLKELRLHRCNDTSALLMPHATLAKC